MILVLISDTIVLCVAVSELGQTPAHYWRAFSADVRTKSPCNNVIFVQ